MSIKMLRSYSPIMVLIGILIIGGTHAIMLFQELPVEAQPIHAILNIVGLILLLVAMTVMK